jgi:hypothetical protein
MAYAAQGNTNDAISEFRRALVYQPNFDLARKALDELQ